ncbi:MAG: DUF2164 domain-containing protein [Candidatus Magasanikbacteria bacterium]|nr:DUF2164 domain-containing protein [Candidatus Magasanikbacteria bacterium]
MNKIKRRWDILSSEERKYFVRELITFFAEERDEEPGMIAGEEVLDFFLQNIGENIYNKGVEDSKDVLKNRFDDLEIDLELLLKK